MSKNFVREIDGIKNINKQEFYTNKANDLLSTKEHNYIRKENQEYHCLTDNVKQTKATNVRYTDTTAKPNVNYNLLAIDNSQVPKTNTNTISATSLVEALEAKDKQIQELKNEIASLGGKEPKIVFYASGGGKCLICETIQTWVGDSDNSYELECLLTFVNVGYREENRLAKISIYDPFKNFLFNDYELTVNIDSDASKIKTITFTDKIIDGNYILEIEFDNEVSGRYNGAVPIMVTLTPKTNIV